MAGKIFINYRRDTGVRDAQLLHEKLKAIFSASQLFIDLEGLDGGVNWMHELQRQVAASDVMVALIGKGWLDARNKQGERRLDERNDFVRFEISEALRREIPVLPVLIDDAEMPKPDQLPQELVLLTYLQAMPLRTISFAQDSTRIAAAIKQLLGRRRRRGVAPWLAGVAAGLALMAGIAAGPFLLDRAGFGFPGVAPTTASQAEEGRRQAERHLAESSSKLEAALRDLAASGTQISTGPEKDFGASNKSGAG